jgi:predicted transposase/invertase (TIGR01784 family)
VCNEQVKAYGRTRKAIRETIRICKDKNVLKEYLESREQEVLDMLMELYDQEEVMRSYLESERYEAAQEAAQEAAKKAENATKIETAKRLLRMGKLSIEEVAAGSGLTVKEVEELAGLQTV